MTQRKQRRGFTLVELMVVIVILGIIGTMAFVFVLDKPDDAKWTKAQTEMGEISKSLNMFMLDHDGDLPETLDELEEDYFKNGVPKNPFTKEDFIYEADIQAGTYELICYGKDDVEGGEEKPNKDIIYTQDGQIGEDTE